MTEADLWDIGERLDVMCLDLPEVERDAEDWARRFDIRGRTFCFFSAGRLHDGSLEPRLVLRADPDERDALLATGHPFHVSRAGTDRVEVVLDDRTDWVEIRELVTESYRRLAPKKLIALLE